MASSAQASPRQRISSADLDAFDDFDHDINATVRSRLSSSEIPRTYSGLYGAGLSCHGVGPSMPSLDNNNNNSKSFKNKNGTSYRFPPPRTSNNYKAGSNLLPFELSRNRNTDWMSEGGPSLLSFYLLLILVALLTFLAFVPEPKLAWTLTNLAHAIITMVYLHWIKGNPADYMDGSAGELNAMTFWEQVVSKPAIYHLDTRSRTNSESSSGSSYYPHEQRYNNIGARQRITLVIKKLRSRDVLCVVPTILAHASCHVAKYQSEYVMVNLGVWSVVMLPKMPFMNGVRLFGINRTIGIDDGAYETEEEDYDDDLNDDSTNDSLGLDIINEEDKKNR